MLRARLIWDARTDRTVLPVTALPAAKCARDLFDLSLYADVATVAVMPDGRECAVLSDGYRRIRIDIAEGSLCRGPVHLRSVIDGLEGVEAKILTLRRLAAFHRLGGFARSRHRRDRLAPRWILALRAHDAVLAGTPQREIARVLFGSIGGNSDWRQRSDFLRSRVQRLARIGRSMTAGGYRELLR